METNVSSTPSSLFPELYLPSSRWDEWVPLDRVLKLNDTNLAKRDQLNAAAKPAGSSEKKSHHAARDRDKETSSAVSGRRKEAAGGTTGRKRGREEDEARKPEMKLDVPDVLKVVLVDDWEAVTKNNQVPLLISRCPNLAHAFEYCSWWRYPGSRMSRKS